MWHVCVYKNEVKPLAGCIPFSVFCGLPPPTHTHTLFGQVANKCFSCYNGIYNVKTENVPNKINE